MKPGWMLRGWNQEITTEEYNDPADALVRRTKIRLVKTDGI